MTKGPIRRELLTWDDVEQLMTILLEQLRQAGEYDALVMITRGGIIPGGMIAEALDIHDVLTASVNFPHVLRDQPLAVWPTFLQFPSDSLLTDRRVLVVDDVWGSGRTSSAVHGRVVAAGGNPDLCVMHYNPYRSLFNKAEPDFYGAITDAWIVYPWEIDQGLDRIPSRPSGAN